jgi:hypothetical protein
MVAKFIMESGFFHPLETYPAQLLLRLFIHACVASPISNLPLVEKTRAILSQRLDLVEVGFFHEGKGVGRRAVDAGESLGAAVHRGGHDVLVGLCAAAWCQRELGDRVGFDLLFTGVSRVPARSDRAMALLREQLERLTVGLHKRFGSCDYFPLARIARVIEFAPE